MAAGEMGRQLRTQHVRVAACQEKGPAGPVQAVDEKFPLGKVLDFVEKETLRAPIKGIERQHQLIVIFQPPKPLVVEIRISPAAGFHGCPMQRVARLARPPRPHHDTDPATCLRLNNRASLDIRRTSTRLLFPALCQQDVVDVHA